ncbi:hypothetical protein BBJ28_00010780 [Nothophytophthora sp. Chile5]|nr:hypothetical protein BBJ28_00010780 [Nothophytophthora sp. Chile5]
MMSLMSERQGMQIGVQDPRTASVAAMPALSPVRKAMHITHRLLVFAAAMWYIVISMMATSAAVSVLQSTDMNDISPVVVASPLIAGYVGTGTIRQSPLVVEQLGNSTTPRESGTLYLESSSSASFTPCQAMGQQSADTNADDFLRWIYTNMQNKTAYNFTGFNYVELVVPVVDCQFGGDSTMARVHYLVRFKDEPERMLLLPTSLTIQDYFLSEQHERGTALVLMFTVLEDIASLEPITRYFAIALDYPYEHAPNFEVCQFFGGTDEGYWQLETIPRDAYEEPPKPILTARRVGFYIGKETTQVNMQRIHLDMKDNAIEDLSTWHWHGGSTTQDSWAWVHLIHLLFALDAMFHLSLLSFLVFRSFRHNQIWIGDAFASISSSLLYRGVYVLISNHLNGYWTLTEFCVALGSTVANFPPIHYYPEMVHADMLTIYLNLVGVISYVLRERVDPVLAIFCFELGFGSRAGLVGIFPALKTVLVDYANENYELGFADVDTFLAALSPMRLQTVHAVDSNLGPLLVAAFVSIYSTLLLVVLYLVGRKVLRHYRPNVPEVGGGKSERMSSRRRSSGHKNDSESQELMQFETATGAALQKRFGVISSYENYTVVKGQRFTSVDAIYCNGFVIANGKFLVATEDLLALLVMKITHVRFTNIFIYSLVNVTGVSQTARLAYPHTISWADLARIGVSRLS